MPHERRHFVRVSFDAPALLTTAHGAFSVHVVDVSLNGALLTAPSMAELSVGMPCQLTIPLADTGTHIAMSAEVAHLRDGAAGLQCRDIDLDSVTHLRKIIELQLGDPALIERDLVELSQTSN
jgi:hypothetical protein